MKPHTSFCFEFGSFSGTPPLAAVILLPASPPSARPNNAVQERRLQVLSDSLLNGQIPSHYCYQSTLTAECPISQAPIQNSC